MDSLLDGMVGLGWSNFGSTDGSHLVTINGANLSDLKDVYLSRSMQCELH